VKSHSDAKYVVKAEKCYSPDDPSSKIYSFPFKLPAQIDFENPEVLLMTPKNSFVLVKCRLS
jgi:hypothetical protein